MPRVAAGVLKPSVLSKVNLLQLGWASLSAARPALVSPGAGQRNMMGLYREQSKAAVDV